jgi:hypothetical protein
MVTPNTIWRSYDNVFAIGLIVWIAIVAIFHSIHIVRFFVRRYYKRYKWWLTYLEQSKLIVISLWFHNNMFLNYQLCIRQNKYQLHVTVFVVMSSNTPCTFFTSVCL